jgi:hypothetical protein
MLLKELNVTVRLTQVILTTGKTKYQKELNNFYGALKIRFDILLGY